MAQGTRGVSVAHVITSLDVGGAERVLLRAATELRRRGHRQLVICLLPAGPVAVELTAAGVPVHRLDMRPERLLRAATREAAALAGLLRRAAPDVVQTWLYHADLLGGVAARLVGLRNVVWGLHHADLPLDGYGRATAAVGRASVVASRVVPRAIVSHSAAGLAAHVGRGYPADRMKLVPNGVAPRAGDAPSRRAARATLGLPERAFVVGRVGRFHAQKDHRTFLRAAGRLRARHPEARFSLIGEGLDGDDPTLRDWIDQEGLRDAVHLHGYRHDADRVQAAFDVAVSSSAYGEAGPLAVLEAMAAGVPVAATDVGDCARIVGDTGAIVRPRDATALAEALHRLAALAPADREALGDAARRRVRDEFSLSAMVDAFEDLYRRLADDAAGRARA